MTLFRDEIDYDVRRDAVSLSKVYLPKVIYGFIYLKRIYLSIYLFVPV